MKFASPGGSSRNGHYQSRSTLYRQNQRKLLVAEQSGHDPTIAASPTSGDGGIRTRDLQVMSLAG